MLCILCISTWFPLPSPEDRDRPQHTMMQSPRLNKSCDQCRNRKVRCIGTPYVYHVPSASLFPVQRSPYAVPSTPPGRPVTCTHCLVSLPNNHCRDGHLTVNRNETRRVSSATWNAGFAWRVRHDTTWDNHDLPSNYLQIHQLPRKAQDQTSDPHQIYSSIGSFETHQRVLPFTMNFPSLKWAPRCDWFCLLTGQGS